jgi:hypothetical protein
MMSEPDLETKNLALGDFVCPRYLRTDPQNALARVFIY